MTVSDDFHPGEGWREVPGGEPKSKPNMRVTQPDGSIHWYAREAPSTFTLPTEMYTVIRVTWAKGARRGAEDMLVNYLGGWCDLEGTIYTRPDVASSITGFEVLAEPVDARFSERAIRKATAKAVLDRVASEPWAREVDLTKWRGEFGVES